MQNQVADEVTPVRPSGVARIWRSFQRTGLSVRLAVFSALLATLVMGATFLALSVEVRRSTKARYAKELSRNGRTLVGLQRDSRRHLILTAALLAESPALKSAVATYRLEQHLASAQRNVADSTVERVIRRLGQDLPGGALLVTDDSGRVLAGYVRGASGPVKGTDLSTLLAVRNALDPNLTTTDDQYYLAGLEIGDVYYGVGAAPLIDNGFTIGTIVFGERVDSTAVKSLRRDFDGEVVISAGSRIISSTMPDTASRLAATDPGQTGEPVQIGDEEYLVAAIPIGRTQRNTELRITLLQPLTKAVRGLTDELRRDFLLYGVLAVALAALGAALLTRSLLRPLLAFISFIREGAAAERLDHEFDATDASQELRRLNHSFNRLMESLGRKRAELERRGEELAAANEVLTDEIHERERVERALRESEAQLRQSQKLEAIGTLAGGIAHDFNNMLTVISGFTQLAISRLGKDHDVVTDLKQVEDAATSAAGLTHQLLAFSRKQVLQPRVLDLEVVVDKMSGMLRRLIGTHVTLEVIHAGEPARIKADPGQLEQVLLNLAVNARDAMPSGGALTILTGRRKSSSGVESVVLRVRDTGVGMSPEVRDRVFEPFFTTKEVGKGTGLGLSTVYGIVVQSGGTIEIDSVVGKGTTMTVVFPPAVQAIVAPTDEAESALPRGIETILLVDDEQGVLDFARRTLEHCGYTVLTAHGGADALSVAKRSMHTIDALVTDVVMPHLGGVQLVERYLVQYPATSIIYMTGHVDDETTRLDLDESVFLVRKPFSAMDLARAVRAALDMRRAPANV